jgi:hypothetical protein
MTLAKLTEEAQSIVQGQVTKMRLFEGVQIAEMRVMQTLKGGTGSTVYFFVPPDQERMLFQPTVGQAYLLFLQHVKAADLADTMITGLHIADTAGFLRRLADGFGDRIFVVGRGGRNQMRVVPEPKAAYVHFIAKDISMPDLIQTLPVTTQAHADQLRKALLFDVIGYVREIIGKR